MEACRLYQITNTGHFVAIVERVVYFENSDQVKYIWDQQAKVLLGS